MRTAAFALIIAAEFLVALQPACAEATPPNSAEQARKTDVPAGAPVDHFDPDHIHVCGDVDHRAPTSDPAVARLLVPFCTAFIVEGGAMVTSASCLKLHQHPYVHFNVPLSKPDGMPTFPAPEDQYWIDRTTIRRGSGLSGDDWVVFRVEPNRVTGLTPLQSQRAAFWPSRRTPTEVEIIGFGVDEDPTLNGAQQSAVGAIDGYLDFPDGRVAFYHSVDTALGVEGAPVVATGTGGRLAIGLHTVGGCDFGNAANWGTSFRTPALWAALQEAAAEAVVDLEVRAFSVLPLQTNVAGAHLTLSFTVRNAGEAALAGPVFTVTARRNDGPSVIWHRLPLGWFPAGAERSFTIERDLAAEGEYRIWVGSHVSGDATPDDNVATSHVVVGPN